MRALSLWQPWATAMAMGIKRIETRSWSLPSTIRLPFLLAIHAAKRIEVVDSECTADLVMADHVVGIDEFGVVAVVRVVAVEPTVDVRASIDDRERRWGNYSEGRFAWVTEPVASMPRGHAIPCRGFQGLFHLPGDVVDKLAAMGIVDAVSEWRPKTGELF